MSEPRRLNTGDAHNVYHAGDAQRSAATEQQQYEEARRRAREAAAAGGRRTRSFNRVQPSDLDRYRATQAAQPAQPAPSRTVHTSGRTLNTGRTAGAQRQAQQAAQQAAQASRPAQPAAQPAHRTVHRAGQPAPRTAPAAQPAASQPTMAQRQAMALQRQAAAKQNAAGARAQVQHLDLSKAQSERAAFDFDSEAADFKTAQPAAEAAAKAAAGSAGAKFGAAGKTTYRGGGGAGGGQPPKGPGKNGKGSKGGKGAGPYNGKGKKKRKRSWWKVLLGTFLALVLIFGGTIAFILHSIAPETGGTTLDRIFNTPQEYSGKELNFLMVGVDRTDEDESNSTANTEDVNLNDGNTDMILYVHFNNETGELKMLQIPRDTMVTTDQSISGNYRLNNVARTQGTDGNLNINALCEQVATMYKVPIDGYVMIHLEMLTRLVDTFGGVELYVPQDMDDQGSHLSQGYQTLDGNAVEFLLRSRHVYVDGDIGRLNMQRQFYAAMFRKVKSIGNIWDVAKLAPAVLGYMETSLPITDLVSFAVSVLNIDSSKIMICQMPVYTVSEQYKYNGQWLSYPARQQDADLLNQYFRENTGPVDASELVLCDSVSELGFDVSTVGTATDPNVQYMGSIMEEQADAQQNDNIDGSNAVTYVDPTPDPSAASESTEGDAASTEATDDAA